ncbi:Fructosamine kinase-domain-containing protein [Podospora aff. communis PSN243]|uniref:protein-ribulosamine 3-kinase n=1 Tax=Podospora aff. communis PSN243 TaxID=3040156 RepID=A0AAV9GFL5_9PEZI|nr:Fructosamine kinase-domain-containing protein [Podospora aff. communis PSN243]
MSCTSALPVPGSVVLSVEKCGKSLWGETSKLVVVPKLGELGMHMCHGEFESLQAIDAVSPGFVPKPCGWGEIGDEEETYFLLVEFRHILRQTQPASPIQLSGRLADMHLRSVSPTGKFGFHIPTCHAKIIQAVNTWDASWCVVFTRHLSHIINLASLIFNSPAFNTISKLLLAKVVPRLLLPLQAEGRVLKPCLIHGDCWDGNTAVDGTTGETFVFDACSFYGHNEYDTGNWRAPRHELSSRAYIEEYKSHFPVSEPAEDWDARNRLYSLPYNLGNALYIPGSTQKQVVYDDMTALCEMFCPADLSSTIKARLPKVLNRIRSMMRNDGERFEESDSEEK